MEKRDDRKAKILVNGGESDFLIDDPLSISVLHLQPSCYVTLISWVKAEKKKFGAVAHFRADKDGCVHLTSTPSIGGDYRGIKCMGLLTHSKPLGKQSFGLRLLLKDVAKPLRFHLKVHLGLLSHPDIFSEHGEILSLPEREMCGTSIYRRYQHPSVSRILVRYGRIRGVLFLPNDTDGPFPGVIDLFGTVGGLVEHRAALLASRGFATLALAYFAYEDLPTDFNVQLDYFEEAIEWLLGHDKVRSGGVGIVGVSKGAEIAIELVTHFPKVACAVGISGAYVYWSTFYKGKPMETEYVATPEEHRRTLKKVNGAYTVNYPEMNEKHFKLGIKGVVPVEQAEGHILYVVGLNDTCMATDQAARQSVHQLVSNNRNNYELLEYVDAGHLIEPPYTPLCAIAYHPTLNDYMHFGGKPDGHAIAQEDSWLNILRFLNQHLPTRKSQL